MSDPSSVSTAKKSPAELLAQADELMRKNRTPSLSSDDDLPVLDMTVDVTEITEVVPPPDTNWDALCENVYRRVMQQLDLYAEFGLKERISRDMRPQLLQWIDGISHELSNDIASNVRRYVAQAIEDEVAKLKSKK